MRQRLSRLAAGLCFLALAGCYRKVSENGALVFSFEPWIPLLAAVIGVAAIPVGIVLFVRKQYWLGVFLGVGVPLLVMRE